VGEAWRLVAGKVDGYAVRTIFLRAALAALSKADTGIDIGQLKTVFDQGIQPQPWRNASARECLQQHLRLEQVALFESIYVAINESDGIVRLNSLPEWQVVEPVPVDAPWPQQECGAFGVMEKGA